uniref:C3H1-type domain-containing protein n=1 Tax=Oncorhynchus tshawytscha TaxID=74940 RepID=A0AAZ3REG4_ONCTS
MRFSSGFLTQLVCDLLDEGNAMFREGEWQQAIKDFSEGVNVAHYAQAESLEIPSALLESLYFNRAAAYHSMGEYEQGVQDCDSALALCKDSCRALYRKALCLRELGRFREAYNCSTGCLLTTPNDKHVYDLAQELANKLGLKIRKAYVSTQSLERNGTRTSWLAKPSPNPDNAGPIMRRLMGLPVAAVCNTAWDRTQVCSEASSTAMQCLRPLRHSGGALLLTNKTDSFKAIIALRFTSLLSFYVPPLTPLSLSLSLPLCTPLPVYHSLPPFPCLSGPGVLDYQHQAELAHRCKRDILLCRIRAAEHPVWNRVRPRPTHNFTGAFMLCKEVLETQKCKYRAGCTFAYCQEEVDVWTLERKGALNRELLFDSQSPNNDRPTLSIKCLLQLHNGMFMYLCEECYDSKPRIISKHSKEVPSTCSNPYARHPFDKNKCLVHAVRSSSVHYTKIRPLYTQCQLDVCRHAQRYGCQREDSCSFAHSVIELKCWRLQQDSGITHEEIVQESKRHWHKKQEQNTGGGGYSLNLKRKFVCGQCWRDGLVSEPDKVLKYCAAKARHSWTKERRVLLVKFFEGKKWVMVRTLPFAKTYPQQYDICAHVVKQKKCHYIGNCAFAHSEEEKQVWTYMKNNGLKDMQQMYDMWLTNQNRPVDDTLITQHIEEKQIVMPTDYAEPMSGFHCRLCGRHSNSERQWQQHISSEKHKDRVFSCEGEDESLTWTYRFPGLRLSGCLEGVSCDYAHSAEELVEWQERREFLRRKLAKAREDMLIMPDEFDFGKYNFLLQD